MLAVLAMLIIHLLLVFVLHKDEDRPERGLPRIALATPARTAVIAALFIGLLFVEAASLLGLLRGGEWSAALVRWTLVVPPFGFVAILLTGGTSFRKVDLLAGAGIVLLAISLRFAGIDPLIAPEVTFLTYPIGILFLVGWAAMRLTNPLDLATYAGATWLVLCLQRTSRTLNMPLIRAARAGDVALVRALLAAPPPYPEKTWPRVINVAFANAICDGHPKTALLLLEAGADPRAESDIFLANSRISAASAIVMRFVKRPDGAYRELVLRLLAEHDMGRPDRSGRAPMDLLRERFSAQEVLELRVAAAPD